MFVNEFERLLWGGFSEFKRLSLIIRIFKSEQLSVSLFDKTIIIFIQDIRENSSHPSKWGGTNRKCFFF